MVRIVNRVGRYTLIASLGAGSTGRVYAARDDDLDRLVALKIVRSRHRVRAIGSIEPSPEPSLASLRVRVLAEARAMARVSHPNLVNVFEVGESEGTFFIAMELVHGKTLTDWLGERLRSTRDIIAAFAAAGRGLAAAHHALYGEWAFGGETIGQNRLRSPPPGCSPSRQAAGPPRPRARGADRPGRRSGRSPPVDGNPAGSHQRPP